MSDSGEMPWSSNPNAPQIPYSMYVGEKAIFAGIFLAAVFFGITIVLFFQCVGALLNPVNGTKGVIKWGLVAHTTAMFSFFVIPIATHLSTESVSYIDNRRFYGGELYPPGPLGYQYFIDFKAINSLPKVMFPLNQWLADGILLYRCYVIYSMNSRVTAFSCLMYLISVAMGIMSIYESMQPAYITDQDSIGTNITISYYSISISLNVILTLMIVIRLALHSRNIRNVTGATTGISGLYKAVVTTLVESSALYTVAFLLYIGPWIANSYLALVFSPVLGGIQVIAPFLITLRVANRRALTSEMITPGNVGSIHFRSQGWSTNGETFGGFETDTTTEEPPL